jgi:5-enolpyruvylshikimate-3-phosphate synthase
MKRRPIKELLDAYKMINNEVEVIHLEDEKMLPVKIMSKGWR